MIRNTFPNYITKVGVQIKNIAINPTLMESVPSIESLYQYHSLGYKILEGDKKGISSVRVNDQYRIEFTVTVIDVETLITICNILDLSNHYK